jgi:hypothetical protein
MTMRSSATGQEIRARIRWWYFAFLPLALAFHGTVLAQAGVPDVVTSHAQTAACDAKYAACQIVCLTTPECETCKKEWLDCKGKTEANIIGIITSLPNPQDQPQPNPVPQPHPTPGPNPKMQQKMDEPHIIDGCSVPGILGGQDPCGGVLGKGSTEFGRPQRTDNGNVMEPGDSVDDLPCNKHDICYQTCGSDKSQCDQQMYDDMMAVCNKAYPEAKCPFVVGSEICNGSRWKCLRDCQKWYNERASCANSARKYKWGLTLFGGSAYEERQEQFCEPVGGP